MHHINRDSQLTKTILQLLNYENSDLKAITITSPKSWKIGHLAFDIRTMTLIKRQWYSADAGVKTECATQSLFQLATDKMQCGKTEREKKSLNGTSPEVLNEQRQKNKSCYFISRLVCEILIRLWVNRKSPAQKSTSTSTYRERDWKWENEIVLIINVNQMEW